MKKFVLTLALMASFASADIIVDINKAANEGNIEKMWNLTGKACDNKNAAACALIAAAQTYSNGEYAKALPLYEKACGGNIAISCDGLGLLYDKGEHVRQDHFKAFKYFKKACELGRSEGCHNVGFLYGNGRGVRQNGSMAKEYYGKACDLGYSQGCEMYRKLNEAGY